MTLNNKHALFFNGNISSYLNVGNHSLNIKTIEMFVTALNTTKRQIFFHYGVNNSSSKNSAYFLEIINNKFRITWGDTYTYGMLDSVRIISPNETYHLAVVYENGFIKMYIDGVLDNSASTTIIPSASLQTITIGKSIVANFELPLAGSIDEVRIWSKSRTAQEITEYKNIYVGNLKKDGLEFYYRLEEGNGNIAYDESTKGRNATLFNTSWITGQVDLFYIIKLFVLSNNNYMHYNLSTLQWEDLSQTPTELDWMDKGSDIITKDMLQQLSTRDITGKITSRVI